MSVFNYKGVVFAEHKGEKYHVLTFNYLNHNQDFREVTITYSPIGNKAVWCAQYSGFTTEYIGSLVEVLDKVVASYLCDSPKMKGDGK